MSAEKPHLPVMIFSRLGSFPIVSSILDTLANNPYTRQPYAHIKKLAQKSHTLTMPVQDILAPLLVPLIIHGDSIANTIVDVLESTFNIQPLQTNPAGGPCSLSSHYNTGLFP
jgi:hypothetical protein